jgi:phenylacetate-CoA ligase
MELLEKKSAVEIKKYQEDALRKLLVYLNEKSPFYKALFTKYQVGINSINTLEDLRKLPLTGKDDLQSFNWDFLCVPKNKIAEYCTTSGTMGSPVTIALTENDLLRLAHNEYLSFLCADATEEDIFQLMVSLDRQFMAGIAYYSGIRKLGAGIIRTGPGNIGMQLDAILRIQPTVLIAVPSFILQLIKYAKEQKTDLNNTAVRKIICIGENIRNDDFTFNALGSQIVQSWKVALYSTYASTEKQTSFTECSHGLGGHLHTELLIFEILDENNQPLPAGEYGELTVTTLGVEGMPLLRYKTGDICCFYDTPCSCGRASYRISPIKGRKQQLIKYNGTTLYPQSIFNILNSIEEIHDYVVQVSKNSIETDDLQIHLSVTDSGAVADKKIRHTLQSALRVLPQIHYHELASIQKMQLVDGKRKASKIIDTRG